MRKDISVSGGLPGPGQKLQPGTGLGNRPLALVASHGAGLVLRSIILPSLRFGFNVCGNDAIRFRRTIQPYFGQP